MTEAEIQIIQGMTVPYLRLVKEFLLLSAVYSTMDSDVLWETIKEAALNMEYGRVVVILEYPA